MSLHGAFWPFQPLSERLRTDGYSTTNPTVLAILHFSHVQLAFYCFSLPRCFLFDLHCVTRGKGEPQASASQTLGGSSLLPVFTGPLQHLLPCVHAAQMWSTQLHDFLGEAGPSFKSSLRTSAHKLLVDLLIRHALPPQGFSCLFLMACAAGPLLWSQRPGVHRRPHWCHSDTRVACVIGAI